MCPRGAKIRFCDFGVRLVPARRKFCGIQKVPQGMILRPLLGVRYRNSQSPIVLSKNAKKPIKFALGANMVSTELSPLQPAPLFPPPGGPPGPPEGGPGSPPGGGTSWPRSKLHAVQMFFSRRAGRARRRREKIFFLEHPRRRLSFSTRGKNRTL
jgi:hypothetical protein